jgi:phosphomannomutase/phosphoglucomutase
MAKSSEKKPVNGSSKKGGKDGRRAQYSLVRIVVRGAAVGLVTLIACFVFLFLYDLPQRNDAIARAQSNEQVQAQGALVSVLLTQMQSRLAAAVQDPTLRADFADPAALAAREAVLKRAFPEALSLRLIALGPLGTAGLDDGSVGLRNNIEADLLRRVAAGAPAAPEAYVFEQQKLISLAQPVSVATGGATAAGALLVTVPTVWLERTLAGQLGARGGISIVQQVGGRDIELAKVGSGDATAFASSATLKTPAWRLEFTPANAWLAGFDQSALSLLLVLALSAAGILLGMLLVVQDIRRALQRNLHAVAGDEELDLPGFSVLRQALRERAAAAPAAAAKTAEAAASAPVVEAVVEEAVPIDLPETIFRAYDIRGIADTELSDDIVYEIALAIGSEAVDRGQQEIIVARDGRTSSERICSALVRGLRDSGRDVIDIGLAPTPLLYFATHQLGTQSGVVVTGSHNPGEYNGLKVVLAGRALSGRAIQGLRERALARRFTQGKGGYRATSIDDTYVDYIVNDVAIAQPLKVVIDAGNGVAGVIAPRLFRELGCEVVQLYCDVDGRFPNHHPDPTVEDNLADLVRTVRSEGADLGIAFDGDGDRVGIVTATGKIVAADRLLMVLAQDVVSRNPGADVLFDVKCSRVLNGVISSFGGRPIMWKSGHSFMKEKMAETGALLGGEFSGHIFFNERWFGFDDGLYAGARLIEILSTTDPDLDNHLSVFPQTVSTPEIKLTTTESAKFDIISRLAAEGRFGDGKITTLDGVRVDYPDGWGLVRASNTTPALIMRFEADNDTVLARIQDVFREQLVAIDPSLAFGF